MTDPKTEQYLCPDCGHELQSNPTYCPGLLGVSTLIPDEQGKELICFSCHEFWNKKEVETNE